MINVGILGTEEIQAALNNLDVKIGKTIVKEALKDALNEILLPAVIGKAPIKTGALTISFFIEPRTGRNKVGFKITSVEKYAFAVEVGHTVGKTVIPAQPYMRTAADENQEEMFSMIENLIGLGIGAEI